MPRQCSASRAWRLGASCLRPATQIAREYVAAQATVLELGIRKAREIIVGSCRGVVVGPVLHPCAEPDGQQSGPRGPRERCCAVRHLFRRSEPFVHIHRSRSAAGQTDGHLARDSLCALTLCLRNSEAYLSRAGILRFLNDDGASRIDRHDTFAGRQIWCVIRRFLRRNERLPPNCDEAWHGCWRNRHIWKHGLSFLGTLRPGPEGRRELP